MDWFSNLDTAAVQRGETALATTYANPYDSFFDTVHAVTPAQKAVQTAALSGSGLAKDPGTATSKINLAGLNTNTVLLIGGAVLLFMVMKKKRR